jgi:hypothetical protein
MRQTVVAVEGMSDEAALETLARRRGVDLEAAGVTIAVIGGAHAIARFVAAAAPEVRLAGLCDAGEERYFRRALEHVFVCDADLEDELIRALGTDAVVAVIAEQRELRSLRTFQKQPAQREVPLPAQLRRFLGTTSGRKIAYGRLLVEALDLGRVPTPLDAVLAFCAT